MTAAGDYRQELDNGQSLQLSGSNPVYPQWLQPAGADNLDTWSQQRDQQLSQVASYQYVSPDVPGAADLDSSGDWQPDTEYGPVWFPRSVSADWAPYHNGHWVNHAPWGWIWVEDESWGYAPFHYGRWVLSRSLGLDSWTAHRSSGLFAGPGCLCGRCEHRWRTEFRSGSRWVPVKPTGRGTGAAPIISTGSTFRISVRAGMSAYRKRT